MAITAAGVGSGLDIENIVSQLMTLERRPLDNLERQEYTAKTQLSAYGQIKSAISSFQDAMKELSTEDKFKIFSSSSSDEDVMTATTDASAAAGIYSLSIDRLAQNHKMASQSMADTATIGGTAGDAMTLTVGTESMSVDLSSAQTLSDIRDSINEASDNPGVTATILNVGGGQQHLVLTANESGYEQRVQTSFSGVQAADFGFTNTNQVDGADIVDLADLDASFSIDGIAVTSATNTVSDVMDGVTFELKQTGSATLNVERDTEAIQESMQSFVSAYNTVLSELSRNAAGSLSGDSSLRSISNQMRSVLNTAATGLTGSFQSLSQIGIKTNANSGQLELNTEDLTDALNTDFSGVAELFASEDQGFAFRFEAMAETFLATDGIVDIREDTLNDRIRSLQGDQADMEWQLELKEKALRSQYASLDSLVGSLQNTSSFLMSQLY